MDEYGSVGPEKPGYEDDVDAIRLALGNDMAVAVPFAANSTKIDVILVPFAATFVLTRPTGFATQRPPIFVGVHNQKGAWLPTEDWLHPGYIGQYLGHPFGWHDTADVDDEPFARFINDVLGHASPVAPGDRILNR